MCNHPERLKRAWVRAVHAVLRMSLPVTVMPTTAGTPAHVAKSAGRGGSWPRPLPLLSSSRARKHSGFRIKSNTFQYLIVNYDPEPKTMPAVEPAPIGGSVNGASVPHHCVSTPPTQGQHLGTQHQGGFPCPRCFGSQGAATPSSLLTALTTLGRWLSSNEHIPELGEGSNRTS